jgi:glycosyltransferase 2 family protein
VLRQTHNVSVSTSLATVLIERLFDGLTMLLFVFVALPLVSFESDALTAYRPFVAVFTALFVGALAVFLVVAARPQLGRSIYEPLVTRLVPHALQDRVLGLAERFLVGLESLASGRDVIMIFVTSVLVWLCETGKYWFVMHAFPFSVSFVTLMLMNGVVNLATTLPAAPGYAGTFDAPGIAVLVSAGVGRAIATAYTLVLHVALWAPVTLLGAFYLWRSRIDIAQVRAASSEAGFEATESGLDATDARIDAAASDPSSTDRGDPR